MAKDKYHILVVDDEKEILELIQFNLEQYNFKVTTVKTGEAALKKARKLNLDVIVLDLMLPGIDGLDVCRLLKSDKETEDIAIIMLTAKGSEEDIVKGLELGADDYLTKPFSPKVLIARINAQIRRNRKNKEEDPNTINFQDLNIHRGKREVSIEGKLLDLTYTEFQILYLLITNPGWVYTRNQIIEAIRGDNYPVTDRSIDFQIVGLRKKLKDYGKYISTVRGVGYRFKDINQD
jgi:two-component system phosphate regulon response regulator PhoB